MHSSHQDLPPGAISEHRLCLRDYKLSNDWQQWTAFRTDGVLASLALESTLKKAGALLLVLQWGTSRLIVADLRICEALDLSKLHGWKRCNLSKQWHADCPVLFASLPPAAKGATGEKRGIVGGWSKRSRKSNWQNLEALWRAGVITAGITVTPLPETKELRKFQQSIQRWLERKGIAHFGNWEGRRPHTHWILCSPLPPGFEVMFTRFCEKQYRRYFPGHDLPKELVRIDTQLEKGQAAIARYYAKVDKCGYETKTPEACPWLKWTPYWHFHLPWHLLDPIIKALPKTPPETIAAAIRRSMK